MQTDTADPAVIVVATVGGDPLTKDGATEHIVSSLSVGSSRYIMMDLCGVTEPCVAVREDWNALDFIVRLLIQSELDMDMYSYQLCKEPFQGNVDHQLGPYDDDADDDDDDNDDATSDEESEMGSSMGQNPGGKFITVDLSPIMDRAHVLRDEILAPRLIKFSFHNLGIGGFADERTDSQASTTTNISSGHYAPTAGDWDHAPDSGQTSVADNLFQQALHAGRWVSSKVAPSPGHKESRSDDELAMQHLLSEHEEQDRALDRELPNSPFLQMLSEGRWYLVSLHEFRCGQCETQNPLAALLSDKILRASASDPASSNHQSREHDDGASDGSTGIVRGLIDPETAESLLQALQRTAPAIGLMANAHEKLLEAVDAVLSCGKKGGDDDGQLHAMIQLASAKQAMDNSLKCFFVRRGISTLAPTNEKG